MVFHLLALLFIFMLFISYISIRKVYNNNKILKGFAIILISYKTFELGYGLFQR